MSGSQSLVSPNSLHLGRKGGPPSTSEIKCGFGGQDPSVWGERPGDGIHGVTVSHLLPVQGPPELLDQGMELSAMTLSPEV